MADQQDYDEQSLMLPSEPKVVDRSYHRRAATMVGFLLVALGATVIVKWKLEGPTGDAEEAVQLNSESNFGNTWVDFQAFVHVGKVLQLDDVLAYPNNEWLEGELKGILILYVMPRNEWKMMINHVTVLVDNPGALPPAKLKSVHDTCKEKMKAANSKGDFNTFKRIRIVSPLDLKDILLSIRRRLGHEKFTKWYEQTTYDAPKFMDTLMRLRGLGNSVPVFRFDVDVAYNQYTKGDMSLLANAITHGVNDYNHAMHDPFIQTFVFSQKYSGMMANRISDFQAWNEAFSTRMNPAFLATPAMLNESQWSETGGWGKFHPTRETLQACIDPETLMKFYGIEKVEGSKMLQTVQPRTSKDEVASLEEDILNMGIAFVGAPPTEAITSGAALCMGPGAALDMAPMIHTPLNIMWVDDYLLDQRTRAISGRKVPLPPKMGEGRVIKARSLPSNPAKYTLELYMPTLFYGIIMDKWIWSSNFDFLAKYYQHLPDSDLARKKLHEAGSKLGPLTRMEEQVRTLGKMPTAAQLDAFKEELWSAAGERMADVWWQWSHLPEPQVAGKKTKTFASLWATGTVGSWPGLERYKTVNTFSKLGLGMVAASYTATNLHVRSRAELPTVTRDDMNPAMAKKLDDLILTVVSQLEWTLLWPGVVQAVRDVNMGNIFSDVTNGLQKAAVQEATLDGTLRAKGNVA